MRATPAMIRADSILNTASTVSVALAAVTATHQSSPARARQARPGGPSALTRYGLTTLTAVTTLDNTGSRTVLARTGFTPTTEIRLNDRPGLRFVRDLRLGR
ncbi:hypothetical protein [Streptomyces sp. NPDC001415]